MAPFVVSPMLPLPKIPFAVKVTIGLSMVPLAYQWDHWFHKESQWYQIPIGTNGRTLNDIGIPLVLRAEH